MKQPLVTTKVKEIKDLDKDLTLKQQLFIKRYFETGNGTKAAMEVYNCKDYETASALASENLRKLRAPMRSFLETKGIDLGMLADKIKEGTDATRATNAAILVTKDGKVEKAEEQGLIEVPDFQVRHKYIETAARWLGVDGNKQAEQQPENIKKRIVAEEFFDLSE